VAATKEAEEEEILQNEMLRNILELAKDDNNWMMCIGDRSYSFYDSESGFDKANELQLNSPQICVK
jgi:hypothetical protein